MLRQTLQPASRPRCLPKVHSLSNARLNHGRGKSVGRRFNTWSESWFLSFSVHSPLLAARCGRKRRPSPQKDSAFGSEAEAHVFRLQPQKPATV